MKTQRCVITARRLRGLIKTQVGVMATDDPKGTCAAYHRGQIAAYTLLLDELAKPPKESK
jgi:hypothetical protein